MPEMTKTVRAIDTEAYRAFRAKAVELGYSTGEAISEAMRIWVNAKSKPRVTVRALAEDPTPAPASNPATQSVAAEPA
jgi:hypothetical protein